MEQREMPFPYGLPALRWVCEEDVKQWSSWRDAVIWCWENRPHKSGEHGDQIMFRHFAQRMFGLRCHAPHTTRWLRPTTKAPMDLPPDMAPALEAFTGWRGLTQYMTRRLKVNAMEELQARMAA